MKSAERPEALCKPGVGRALLRTWMPVRARGPQRPVPSTTTFWRPSRATHLSGLRRSRRNGIFPTDFSSTMPSADCLAAIADIAADPLRGAVFFCVPLSGLVNRSRQPIRAEALVSRCATLPAFYSQSRRLSRGSPGCFRCVTVESTEWAVALRRACACSGLVTGAALCVAY